MDTPSTNIFPVLPLRDLVVFPGMVIPLFVGRKKSMAALQSAKDSNEVLLIAQKDANIEDPKPSDLHKVGVIAKILQVLNLQDGTVKILAEGVKTVKVTKYISGDSILEARVKPYKKLKTVDNELEIKAMVKSVIERFEIYINFNKRISPDVLLHIKQMKDYDKLCDIVVSQIYLDFAKKQELLEEQSLSKCLEKLLVSLDIEIEILNTEKKIKNRVKKQIDHQQKSFFLNEQLKAIHKELGEKDGKDELDEFYNKLRKLKLTKEAKEKVDSEIKKLRNMNPISQEASVIKTYLDWFLDLPWQKYSKVNNDLSNAQKTLDDEHYGLTKVKDHIIEYLAVAQRTNHLKSPILCLIGPPGVGKTSLAKSIANATGRNFIKISLGGLRDEAEIRGHRKTYIGSMPGKIVHALKKAKTNNPVILLDEIDKMGNDYRGDPASAMLEVLDPEQNSTFSDHYMEVDIDLSQAMFIATANTYAIPKPLLDRMEIVNIAGYTEEEKLQIALNYLIPKQIQNHGVKADEVTFNEEIVQYIIRHYTREAGVRSLSREIAKIARKVVKDIALKKIKSVVLTTENIEDYLGVRKYKYGEINENNLVGITNGLAYTEVGGELLAIEVVMSYGKGEIKITGQLGDVMKESAQTAMSYIRSKAQEFGISPELFGKIDIHIHVPEGAVPKDGPSAGIAMCTSLVSVLTGIPVKRDIAMTGEITLRGRVLPIGGLKEKLLAAVRAGVKTVFIPEENKKDLKDLPETIIKNLDIITVDNVKTVLTQALEQSFKPIEWSLEAALKSQHRNSNTETETKWC